jgi:polyisoprenoid-binding protein YceI
MAWNIDSSHTRAGFSVRHMMIANVHGQFEKVSGTVDFNEQDPARSSVDVQIDVASLNTRDEKRDATCARPTSSTPRRTR